MEPRLMGMYGTMMQRQGNYNSWILKCIPELVIQVDAYCGAADQITDRRRRYGTYMEIC